MQKSQERLDIFVDYLESAEWIMPVQSFIDYYCVVFYSQDRNEDFEAKSKIYEEYKSIVGGNLNQFLTGVLKIDTHELCGLMNAYTGTYECLEYVLAVEDYSVFHTFMYETNMDLNEEVSQRAEQSKQNLNTIAENKSLIHHMHVTSSNWGK